MSKFITMAAVTTGRKHRIPAHWLDNPTLAANWRPLPSAANTDGDPAPYPVTDDRDFGLGTTDIADQDELVDENATPADANPGDPNTPAAGGEQEN